MKKKIVAKPENVSTDLWDLNEIWFELCFIRLENIHNITATWSAKPEVRQATHNMIKFFNYFYENRTFVLI